jgi:hypothetical protein
MDTLTGAYFFEELAEGAIEYARLSLTRLVYFFLEGRQNQKKRIEEGLQPLKSKTARAW